MRENYAKNMALYAQYEKIADDVGCTPAQLSLAWLLEKDDNIIPIPGTKHTEYVVENFGALEVSLDAATMSKAG